ncbi:MAG: polyribonucleotide nucleotidyltransferase [Candidatus Nomurabacteria bacterium]|nr:MAG: polyribonucleotide nucleotidyltransferase [Candidatus Nomurabacteria bacterium]
MKIKKEYSLSIGGKEIKAVFSDLAEQASGSVMLSCDGTVVLTTSVIGSSTKGNPGYFNLTVEYIERFYARGKILGGQYNKREGRPSDQAILASRIIDRTIRPLFDHSIKNPVQVITTVLALGSFDPKILAVNAASLAIATSKIPFAGPVACVHVSREVGQTETKINNYLPQQEDSVYDLDLTVCGKEGEIVMIESMAKELTDEDMGEMFTLAMENITEIESWQKKIVQEIGEEKITFEKKDLDEEIKNLFKEKIVPILEKFPLSKEDFKEAENLWSEILEEKFGEDDEMKNIAKDYAEKETDEIVHKLGLEKGKRVDGRDFKEVRSLFAKAGGISEEVHGSGIFYRGETHVMSFTTLAGPDTKQMVEGMESEYQRRFMHHYNFPPYSGGETGRVGGLNRREMGHGFLVEKALVPVMPSKEDFPYTIRVVSECVASNGSTSQASICASTVSLMDAGVPISSPVAGIAMGLFLDTENKQNYKILTDIQGPEDHYGDMDFKVAGTQNGITAIQLDIKLSGVPVNVLKEALVNAKEARLHILETIKKEIAGPREDISPKAPKIVTTNIPVEKIGMVIGSGGKTINEIKDKTGAEITIEDDGTVYATGTGGSADSAIEIIRSMTREWQRGDLIDGQVVKVIEVGAIVKISPFSEGLVHISEIAPWRVEKVTDLLKEGMTVPVKVLEVDKMKNRISLSIKQANEKFFKKEEK